MSITIILTIILLYFGVIFTISYITGKRATNAAYFLGERKSPWYVVAIGMIGTSISGVTFISVPGMVGQSAFSYLQMVLGFVSGYIAIAYILLPLYYRMNLASIYGYLGERYGKYSYKTGSVFFLISKFLGCGVRMYLTALVLQCILFDALGVSFAINVAITMTIVWLYTARGGVKTLVWVDMLQTLALIGAVILCIYYIGKEMHLGLGDMWRHIGQSEMSQTWFFDDIDDKRYFWKQFLAGAFTTIAMTGLDQDMMMKNLSCRNLKEAQKNVLSYGVAFLPVNLLFLALGVLLYAYAGQVGIFSAETGLLANGSIKADQLFPTLATGTNPLTGQYYLPICVGVFFTLGLISAAFSSAGSAITALTTSVTIDLLGKHPSKNEKSTTLTRLTVHLLCCIVMGVLIYLFSITPTGSVIDAVYVLASYTYGPLLGLYIFGLYTHRRPIDSWIPLICTLSPIFCLIISLHSEEWLGGYKMGYELLLLNGAITVFGLWCSSWFNGKRKTIA